MKPYILQVAHLDKVSESQYVAHIAILDSNIHCFTGIPYKTIVVDAINEEFARKIADIRIEEMMLTNASEIDSIYDKNILTDITNNYRKSYANIVVEMEKLRKQQENLLTALVKEAQQSAEEGINIEDMGIEVELGGYEGHLVYAVRTVSDEGSDDHLELKLLSVVPDEHEKFLGVYEYEWLSIYDFHSWAAETILSEIMENL